MRKLGKGKIRIEKKFRWSYRWGEHPKAYDGVPCICYTRVTHKCLPLRCAFIDLFPLDGPHKASWAQWLFGRERERAVLGGKAQNEKRASAGQEVPPHLRLGLNLMPITPLVFFPVSHLPVHPHMIPLVLTKTQARNSESWFSKIPRIKIKQHMVMTFSGETTHV